MNDLLSYLSAQARRKPVTTARFVTGEVLRRGRARFNRDMDRDLAALSPAQFAGAAPDFLPPVLPSLRCGSPAAWMEQTIEKAERIVRGEVEVFGNWVPLGLEPDWHCDWKSRHRWPLAPAGSMRVLDSPPGADVKRPWEAGRFHHGLGLGAAAVLSGDARFAKAFEVQFRHWVEQNPWPRGIHWATPMEAGLRAINWIQTAAFLSAAGFLDAQMARALSRSLFLHGRHVWAQREWNPVARANHYLACVIALLWLGVLFERTDEGRKWLAFGRRELLREMQSQTAADGVAHEGSSGYHAFVTELFFTGALLLARRGARGEPGQSGAAVNGHLGAAIESATTPVFRSRLARMFDFLSALCAGRETPPIWGDADDGRVLPFAGTAESPITVLCAIGKAMAGRPNDGAAKQSAAVQAEIFWRFGSVPQESGAVGPHRSQAFPESGFYFFSSPRIRGSWRCGPMGVRGWSNHAHNDQLSFEFAVDGRAVVVDPGLPCYSEDRGLRNLFRSTRSHNSVEIAGEEQNRIWPKLLFRIVDDSQSKVESQTVAATAFHVAGSHQGYMRLPQRTLVRRDLRLDGCDVLQVSDTLESTENSLPTEARWFFHLAPGITPELVPGGPLPSKPPQCPLQAHSVWRLGPVILTVSRCDVLQGFAAQVSRGAIAPKFGHLVTANILEFRGTFGGRAEARFVFRLQDRTDEHDPNGVLQ